jgi:hypothetical protein
MTAKHTPGKWNLYTLPNSGEWEIISEDKFAIASNAHSKRKNTRDVELANAQLISKAPELLEALEYLVVHTCRVCGCKKATEHCLGCRNPDFKQLIAEAKGKTT